MPERLMGSTVTKLGRRLRVIGMLTGTYRRNHVADDLLRYNGRMSESPSVFPPTMEKACRIVEDIVNEEMKKRKPFNLEWGGDDQPVWRANVAASNCYEGAKDSVGFHSDQLTYLGPYPTIASLSLG
jgi:alkylated DNA repair dioxygenase AlkB